MIAIDTNILVHAHRPEMPGHGRAKAEIGRLARERKRYGLPFHCLVEFSGVVTKPRLFATPSSAEQVRAQIEAWLEPPNAWLLVEDEATLEAFHEILGASGAQGGAVHDARIAACCRRYGVAALWTADRDFSRYPGLRTHDPLTPVDE